MSLMTFFRNRAAAVSTNTSSTTSGARSAMRDTASDAQAIHAASAVHARHAASAIHAEPDVDGASTVSTPRPPFGLASEEPLTRQAAGAPFLSPLQYYTGETHRFAQPNMRVTTERAAELVETGAIDRLDIAILQCIARLNYANANQLMLLVRSRGPLAAAVVGMNEIQNRLVRLTNLGFARTIRFFRVDGRKLPHLAYCLGQHGYGILRKRGEWAPSLDRQAWEPLPNIKRLMAAHLVTAPFVSEHAGDAKVALLRKILLTGPREVTVRPTVFLENPDGVWLVEAVLRSPEWENELAGKLTRYAAVLRNPMAWQYPTPHTPTLVLVGENPEHLHHLQTMVGACTAMSGLPVLYTTARLLNHLDAPAFFGRIDTSVLVRTEPEADTSCAG